MHTTRYDLQHETDDHLLRRLAGLIATSNSTTADVLAHLAEIDRRKLYAPQGYSSLFAYAMSLGLSESAVYKRIQCARLALRWPVVFEVVAKGEVHLSGLALLAPHLTEANHLELLAAARHQSKRRIEELVAAHVNQPDAPPRLRRLPSKAAPTTTGEKSATAGLPFAADMRPANSAARASAAQEHTPTSRPAEHAAVEPSTSAAGAASAPPAAKVSTSPAARASGRADVTPLSAERFRLQVTLSRRGRDLLLLAQSLLRHRLPDGDLSQVCEEALSVLVEQLQRRKFAKLHHRPAPSKKVAPTAEPSPGQVAAPEAAAPAVTCSRQRREATRYIPAAVRRAVAERDGYRCTFVGADGHCCNEEAWLEYHHLKPFARGGKTSVANVTLRCHRHNAHAAEIDYGRELLDARRRGRDDAGVVGESEVQYSATRPPAECLRGALHRARRAVWGACRAAVQEQEPLVAPDSTSSPRAGLRLETSSA